MLIIFNVNIAPGFADSTEVNNNNLESRMDLIIEFDCLMGDFLDKLFSAKNPDVAMLEWCEKSEMRAIGYPQIQKAFGYLYISIKSRIKGDVNRGRITFQQAIRLMAGERYKIIKFSKEKEMGE